MSQTSRRSVLPSLCALVLLALVVGVNTPSPSGAIGTGHNMFAVKELPQSSLMNAFEGLAGYDYYVGDRKFTSAATALAQIGGHLLIAFDGGRMLKVNGTGGSGHNMFAVEQLPSGSANAFAGLSGYDYYVGDAKFSSSVTAIAHVAPHTLIGFSNGAMLKINGTGGTGHNMFAVKALPNSSQNAFESLAGYSYYVGDAKFGSAVVAIRPIGSQTLIAFDNGTLLKVNGTGGGGHNMFAVKALPNNSQNAFEGLSGYNYYAGDAKFSSAVTALRHINAQTLIGFADGRMLKVNGGGGGGHNMFAVKALPNSSQNAFEGLSGYDYYAGDAKFHSGAADFVQLDGFTVLPLANGAMLKIKGTGGGGHNMFAVKELPGGSDNAFEGLSGYDYYVGDAKFTSAVSASAVSGQNTVVWGFANGKMLSTNGAGGTGHNMFAVKELPSSSDNAFEGLGGFSYYAGDAKFSSKIKTITAVETFLVVGLSNGKMLKVK